MPWKQLQERNGTADSLQSVPETFLLSKDTITTEDYRMNGTIIDYVPRGNVLRYHIDINGVEVYADVLFRSMSMFNVGEKINVGVADHNCVRL